jgi:predicted MFS family arabinose efflux permease
VLAATIGLGTGSAALTLYTTSIIAPHMIADLGWSRSSYAMLGTLSIVPTLCFPLAGRLADLVGVKRTVLIGIIILPLCFLGYSLMTGEVWQYIVIQLAAGILGITTTNTIYSRVAVQYSERARGLALAIVASGPAVTGIILSPLVNTFIETEGWRTTYQVLALYVAVAGVITLLMLPPERKLAAGAAPPKKRRAREDYPLILRTPIFWILLVAMFLCNLPQILAFSQLKMVLTDNGIDAKNTSVMLAALPFGVLVGRFVAGLALDRFPAPIVGFVGTGLPSIGLLLIATNLDSPIVLTFAVLCIGFSIGADGDILAFVVSRKFGLGIYSSVMGLMTMAISFAVSAGAALLSVTLRLTGGFDAFLLMCAAAVFGGSLLFLFIGPQGARDVQPQAA